MKNERLFTILGVTAGILILVMFLFALNANRQEIKDCAAQGKFPITGGQYGILQACIDFPSNK